MPRPKTSRHKRHEVLTEQPVLESGQIVVKVIRACGENIYEVENEDGSKLLYRLPKRLRHIAFIRRGCYVFVRDDHTRGPGKVKGEIEVVVLDRFLSSLQNEPFWPSGFTKQNQQENVPGRGEDMYTQGGMPLGDDDNDESNDGNDDGDNDDDDWEIGAGNPNRQNWSNIHGEDSDSSDDG